jgi:hypothetical protein
MKEPRYKKEDTPKRVFRHTKGSPKNLAHLENPPIRIKSKPLPKPLPDNIFVEKRGFVNTVELKDNPKLYAYIRRALKKQFDGKVLSIKRMRKILRFMFKTISSRIVTNDGGVYIRNFGYFCVMRHPQKKIYTTSFKKDKVVKYHNFHSGGFAYSPIFIPIRKDVSLREWSFYRSFYPYNITRKMSKNLKDGKQYKMNFSLIYNMNANRNKTLDVINTQSINDH